MCDGHEQTGMELSTSGLQNPNFFFLACHDLPCYTYWDSNYHQRTSVWMIPSRVTSSGVDSSRIWHNYL